MDLYFLAFGGSFGCFSATVFLPFCFSGPCLREPSCSCGDCQRSVTRFCESTVAESSSASCEDERGATRSRDLDLASLLERPLCSADGGGPADGNEGFTGDRARVGLGNTPRERLPLQPSPPEPQLFPTPVNDCDGDQPQGERQRERFRSREWTYPHAQAPHKPQTQSVVAPEPDDVSWRPSPSWWKSRRTWRLRRSRSAGGPQGP